MLHAAGVAVALGADEVVGIQHDLVEALVPVQLAQMQQRQLGLGGEKQPLLAVQLNAGQGAQVFVMQKQYAGFAQPVVFVGTQAVEHRQALANPLPALRVDGVTGQGAATAPGAQ
ncbi:hypothetical protein D3C84_958610 [compost metagenome]